MLRREGDNEIRSKRFCPNARYCALRKFHVIRWSKHAQSNSVLCIPFIPSGSPNECWLHTCDACVITTLRLGLRAPLVARNNDKKKEKKKKNGLLPFHSFQHKI